MLCGRLNIDFQALAVGDDHTIIQPRALKTDQTIAHIIADLLILAFKRVAIAAAAGVLIGRAFTWLDRFNHVIGDDLGLAVPCQFQPTNLGFHHD